MGDNSEYVVGEVNFHPTVPQGWQCPVCKRVYAPGVCECFNCNQRDQAMYPGCDSVLEPLMKTQGYGGDPDDG